MTNHSPKIQKNVTLKLVVSDQLSIDYTELDISKICGEKGATNYQVIFVTCVPAFVF